MERYSDSASFDQAVAEQRGERPPPSSDAMPRRKLRSSCNRRTPPLGATDRRDGAAGLRGGRRQVFPSSPMASIRNGWPLPHPPQPVQAGQNTAPALPQSRRT